MILSNIMFGFAEVFPTTSRRYVLFASRFFSGLGAGIVSVTRAFCATASTLQDRLKAVTLVQSAFVIGFLVGPALNVR